MQKKKKPVIANAYKKLLNELRHCLISEKCNFILSVSCNIESKLKITLQFPLAKDTFN